MLKLSCSSLLCTSLSCHSIIFQKYHGASLLYKHVLTLAHAYLLESNKSSIFHESYKSYWSFKYLNPKLTPWDTINCWWNLYTSILKNHLQTKVGTPNSALDLQLSQLLTPIIAQNLEQWVHIDQDDLNKINICSQRSFRTSTNKTLNPYNFCVQYPNCVFFSAFESSCICQ
jgi:hypothetical protein